MRTALLIAAALSLALITPAVAQPRSPGQPGVLLGAGLVTKGVFFTEPPLGTVTDIAFGDLDRAPGPEIVIAGDRNAVILDGSTLRARAFVAFAGFYAHVDVIDVEADGECEFMNRGAWGVPAALLDHTGREVWTYGRGLPGVDDMAAGDVDGNGVAEFAVGFNGGGGLHLVERTGQMRWRAPDGNVWHVEMLDVTGDGRPEILHSNARGVLTVRNVIGSVVSEIEPPTYLSFFSVVRWPGPNPGVHLLVPENGVFLIMSVRGEVVARLAAPRSSRLSDAWAVPLRARPDGAPYVAVLQEYRLADQAMLFIYDPSGALVYHEILSENAEAIATLDVDGGRQALLVGGTGRVLQYEFRP